MKKESKKIVWEDFLHDSLMGLSLEKYGECYTCSILCFTKNY